MKTNSTAKAITEMAALLENMQKGISGILKNTVPEEELITTTKPIYFKEGVFDLPTVYRFNQKGMRYYFTVNENRQSDQGVFEPEGLVTFYPSVTTIIEKTTPTSYGIKKLLSDMGMTEFYRYMKEKAEYGTLVHTLITEYLNSSEYPAKREFDTDTLPSRVQLYAEENQAKFDKNRIDYSNWSWMLQKDLRSLIKFIHDHKVDPIAIEIVGTYNDGTYRYAGAIDLICEMTIEENGFWGEVYKSGDRKGQQKETKKEIRVTAIVDFKSGKAGFFQDHEVQLHMYKLMAEQSFGIKIDRVFNVAPKEWVDVPSFHIADQTKSLEAKRIPHLLGSFYVDFETPKEIQILSGKINGEKSLEESCKRVSAADFVWKKLQEREMKTQGVKPQPKKEPKPKEEKLDEEVIGENGEPITIQMSIEEPTGLEDQPTVIKPEKNVRDMISSIKSTINGDKNNG